MNKIDKVKLALYNIASPTPQKVAKAKWVMYGSAAVATALLFAAHTPSQPKLPPRLGD